MKLRIEIDMENDALNGRNKGVREVSRILAEWLNVSKEMGRLNEQSLRDINGNRVGAVELIED